MTELEPKRKKRMTTGLLLLMLFAGMFLLLYPTVSNWWNSFHQTRAVTDYSDIVGDMNTEEERALLKEARAYNKSLVGKGPERFTLSEAETEEYEGLLNFFENGMMGYIEIPALRTTLPIYHGTSDAVLSAGVGHIEGTSLPVGGKGTHCVLSGHRGLPSARLFTDLDRLVEGDRFMLHILGETLTYEVDRIHIVEPQEVGDLAIAKGEDYCTLVTCTPYGINTHRLLVRGHRVDDSAALQALRVPADAVQIEPLLVAPFLAIPILLVLLIILLLPKRRR